MGGENCSRMKNDIFAINPLVDMVSINLKSIYKTSAQEGDFYKCKLNGEVYFCYVFVLKGKIKFRTVQSLEFELTEGCATFLWSNDIQSYTMHGEEIQYFWVYFSMDGKKPTLMKPFEVLNVEKTSANLYRCISLLLRATSHDTLRANMIFTKYILEGIEKLLEEEVSAGGSQRIAIANSIDYIKGNLYNLPSIQELANLVGMSLKQYRKHFKKTTGVYPAKYIYDQKMLVVKECLLNTELTIAQIAEMMDFSSAYYLSSCFKKSFGCTPTEYRKRVKK